VEDIKKIDPKSVSDIFQIAPIALDTYDDIFSDFDPSPFDHRVISEDFLSELRRRYNLTPKDNFVVHFTLPKQLRSEKIELLVKRRIKEHFRDHVKKISKLISERKHSGYFRIVVGIAVLILNILLGNYHAEIANAISELLLVVAWYFFWTGLERIFEQPEKLIFEKNFLEKFSKADYIFLDQEEVVKSITNLQGGYL
jgi:hypothetical protein